MRKRILSALMAIVMVILVCIPAITTASAATGTTTEDIIAAGSYDQESARSMLTLVNGLRTGNDAWYWNSDNTTKTVCKDLKEYTYDYALEQIAMQRAAELVKSFSHTRPDGSSCFTATYKGVQTYGENIAYASNGLSSVRFIFDLWAEADENYAGQGHRRNMLSKNFAAIGIACFEYKGTKYWVQEFGLKNSGIGHTHTADDTWHYNATNHWHECIAGDGGKADNAVHSGGKASCTKKAVCSVCGQSYGNYGSHTFVTIVDIPPTKNSTGLQHKECSACGYKGESTEIPMIHVVYDEENGWHYEVDGVADWTYSGFSENENGTWYVVDGKVNFNVNNVLYDSRDGQKNWKYIRANKFVDTYTGIASNSNGWWRIENGIVNFGATGVFQNENGWWYVKGGQVQFDHTGIKNNDYGWWRIVNGKVDFGATGVYQNENGWWYCKGGQVQFNYTGVQSNSNGWWRIESGKVNFNFTGIASNANGSWYLKNGKVDFSKNGKVTYQGKTYTVKGGKVV